MTIWTLLELSFGLFVVFGVTCLLAMVGLVRWYR